jgi:hypothetical protein
VFVAHDIRLFVTIMNNVVPSLFHHLTKLENLLGVRAPNVFSICNSMWQTKTVKSH